MSGIMQLHQLRQMEQMRGEEPFQEPIPTGGRPEGISREQMGWGTAGLATGLAPGAGVADAFGYLPDPFAVGEQYPSMAENVRQGQWADVGMQALGLGADALTAIGPPGIAAGTMIRGARAAKRGRAVPEEGPPVAAEPSVTSSETYRVPEDMEAAYIRAAEQGDEATAQRLFDEALQESGAKVFNLPDTVAYAARRAPPPENMVPRFKAFRMTQRGLTPLYVGATDVLPMNTWLDAKSGGYHFIDARGRSRVPAGTGDSAPITPEVAQELFERGLVGSPNVKTMKSVAYRPGWHAGTLPYNPQGAGARDPQWSRTQGWQNAEHPYMHILGPDVVIGQVTMPADRADHWRRVFEDTAVRTRDGRINLSQSGVREVPVDGYYNYTTNANNLEQPGTWSIGGSLRIDRLLSHAEADEFMRQSGFPPQLRHPDSIDPATIDTRQFDYSRHVLPDPILRDRLGRVVPLSNRLALGDRPRTGRLDPVEEDRESFRRALQERGL